MGIKEISVSAVLALGISVAGGLIGWGFFKAKESERYVTVKGLAEEPVNANQGTWKVSFSSMGKTLTEAISGNSHDREVVMNFLLKSGFKENEIRPDTPRVVDHQDYKSGEVRFSVSDSVVVISDQVELIRDVASKSGSLLQSGIALTGWDKPQYYYTGLGSIKPVMIEKATRDARNAAEKFAQDSGSGVGSIRRASQGYFSFRGESEGIPETEQVKKIARVVITVDYSIVK